jgi:hypothetical protein
MLTFTLVGSGEPPSVHMIKKKYNALLHSSRDHASLKACKSEIKPEHNIKKSEEEDGSDAMKLTTPTSKIKMAAGNQGSTSSSKFVRSGKSTSYRKRASAKKRKLSSDSEEEAAGATTTDSDDALVTPSKRVLPSRRSRKTAMSTEKSGFTDEDDFKDDAEKDFGGVGDDAEYGVESE